MNDRFAGLADALAAPPDGTAGLAVGFSGGLDSSALLHALAARAPAIPLRGVHVCHHLQPEAEAWAAHCRAFCQARGIAFTRLDVRVDGRAGGMEAAAREARYEAIAATLAAGETFVTAHHRDDQAETFLLQALRGSGPDGLASMPSTAAFAERVHWRPWLDIAQSDIRAYAARHELDWIEDPSNRDPHVARSFIRSEVLPLIETRWPAAAATLSRAATYAQEAREAIEALATADFDRVRDHAGTLSCEALKARSFARRKQVVRHWLARAGRDTPDHRQLAQILRLTEARLTASPCVRFAQTDVRLFDGRLHAMPALDAVPEADAIAWTGRNTLHLPNECGSMILESGDAAMPTLTVAFRRGGERLLQAGGTHRRLKDVLREARVAPWVRERMPLIHLNGELIVVPGIWRHPRMAQVSEHAIGTVVWRHRLMDGTLRVVRA